MPRKKKLLTVYLDPGQLERLRALSLRTRIPIAVYQREGIDLVLHREKVPGMDILSDICPEPKGTP